MPTLSVTVNAQSATRIIEAFTAQANSMGQQPPIVVDQKWVENWMKDSLQMVVHRYENAKNVVELPPPAPIT
jgi:hypothetical protein